LSSQLIFLSDITDFDVIHESILLNSDNKIFSFDLDVHKKLDSKKIIHNLADTILNKHERLKIFDCCIEFLHWHSKIHVKDFEFEGVNLLKLSDSHEFHSFLMPVLIKFVSIKKIIEEEKPKKIICSSLLSSIVNLLVQGTDIKIQFFQNDLKNNLLWDKISINYNFGKIPISLKLSKKNYLKMKKLFESLMGYFSNFWLDLQNPQKSIVLLEFNTELFSNLLNHLKNYDGNVILVNHRRSALWSKKAIDAVKKSNCKILNSDKILSNHDKSKISKLSEEYSRKLENFWNNSPFFENFFQIEDLSFWEVIKDVFIKSYNEKLTNFILLIQTIKILFENMDIRCIASLNEVGETEKAFLEFNKNKIPSILLEHGFVERDNQTKRFDKVEYLRFKDKLAVWGNVKKNFMIDEYGIESEKIIVTGSPRHDDYFNSKIDQKMSKEITVLLAPNPITEISGFANTKLELKFEQTMKDLFSILNKFENIKLIVKLHATQLNYNKKIKHFLNKIDSTIPVYQSTGIIETINKSDIVIVISPENFGTSTMLLESMILGKPSMNIILDDEIPQFSHIKQNAVFTISSNDNLDSNVKKILFDEKFKNEIKKNANTFLTNFLDYKGNASEEFAKILKSF